MGSITPLRQYCVLTHLTVLLHPAFKRQEHPKNISVCSLLAELFWCYFWSLIRLFPIISTIMISFYISFLTNILFIVITVLLLLFFFLLIVENLSRNYQSTCRGLWILVTKYDIGNFHCSLKEYFKHAIS